MFSFRLLWFLKIEIWIIFLILKKNILRFWILSFLKFWTRTREALKKLKGSLAIDYQKHHRKPTYGCSVVQIQDQNLIVYHTNVIVVLLLWNCPCAALPPIFGIFFRQQLHFIARKVFKIINFQQFLPIWLTNTNKLHIK